jgi:hypothetical protein
VSAKEATARIKINKLLEAAGWRFFAEGGAPANIRLEPGVSIKATDLDALDNDFKTTRKGFVDFLSFECYVYDCEDVSRAIEVLRDPVDPVLDWESARRDLIDQP